MNSFPPTSLPPSLPPSLYPSLLTIAPSSRTTRSVYVAGGGNRSANARNALSSPPSFPPSFLPSSSAFAAMQESLWREETRAAVT